MCAPLGVGALPIDDEPDRDALGGLPDQRVGEYVSDDARPEAELVDVNGRRGAGDVLEHPRVEATALDEGLHGRSTTLGELDCELSPRDWDGEEALCVSPYSIVRYRDSRARPHVSRSRRAPCALLVAPAIALKTIESFGGVANSEEAAVSLREPRPAVLECQ